MNIPEAGTVVGTPAVSVAQRVLNELRREIVTTELEPGSVVREADIAARFGVSKTPVREALQKLLAEDFIQVIPRRGYIIRPVGLHDIRDVMTMRGYIEPPMTAEAALHRSEFLLDRLADTLTVQSDANLNHGARLSAATEFHRLIISVARNRRAERLLQTYFDETSRLHYIFNKVNEHVVSAVELNAHQRILDAISAGDAPGAERAMADHLTEAKETLLRSFH